LRLLGGIPDANVTRKSFSKNVENSFFGAATSPTRKTGRNVVIQRKPHAAFAAALQVERF